MRDEALARRARSFPQHPRSIRREPLSASVPLLLYRSRSNRLTVLAGVTAAFVTEEGENIGRDIRINSSSIRSASFVPSIIPSAAKQVDSVDNDLKSVSLFFLSLSHVMDKEFTHLYYSLSALQAWNLQSS